MEEGTAGRNPPRRLARPPWPLVEGVLPLVPHKRQVQRLRELLRRPPPVLLRGPGPGRSNLAPRSQSRGAGGTECWLPGGGTAAGVPGTTTADEKPSRGGAPTLQGHLSMRLVGRDGGGQGFAAERFRSLGFASVPWARKENNENQPLCVVVVME